MAISVKPNDLFLAAAGTLDLVPVTHCIGLRESVSWKCEADDFVPGVI